MRLRPKVVLFFLVSYTADNGLYEANFLSLSLAFGFPSALAVPQIPSLFFLLRYNNNNNNKREVIWKWQMGDKG